MTNTKIQSPETQDIIVFTLHKSASMFLHTLCEYLCKLSDIQYQSPNYPSEGINPISLLTDKDLWKSRHGCFAPVRFYVDVPDMDDYRIILHLRDPRDVLVSMYFSYCYIHLGEIPGNTGYRKEVADLGIDEFVLQKATEETLSYRGDYGTGGHVQHLTGNLVKKYQDYIENILPRANVTFLKYEDMVLNFKSWLEEFIKPFPLADRDAVINNLAEKSSDLFPARNQDVMAHIRHVTPGDHKNKLKPATVEKLNIIFKPVLQQLHYI